MRILILSSTYHPLIGGAETYAMNLAKGLAELRHHVMVITDLIPNQPNSVIISEYYSIKRLYQYREKFNAIDTIFWEQMQFGLYNEISLLTEDFKPDIIISNSLDLCVPAKLISIHTGKPWVATSHEQSPEKEAFGIAKLQLELGILNPNAIIAGSKYYLSRALLYGNQKNIHLIYHGIDTNQFVYTNSAEQIRGHYNIPTNHYLILSAGRLTPRKGFQDLIHALSLLKARGHLTTLIIAGSLNSASEKHKVELEELIIKLNLTQEVIFDQNVMHDEMPKMFSASDIVVQASLAEGLGLAVIEAMSCSRPVVTTRIPGIEEIMTIDGIGVLVRPNSPVELANAIEELLNDQEARQNIGLKARDHIIKNFSIARMIQKSSILLEELIKE